MGLTKAWQQARGAWLVARCGYSAEELALMAQTGMVTVRRADLAAALNCIPEWQGTAVAARSNLREALRR